MKDFIIENEKLTVSLNPVGAEVKSVCAKADGLEYMWQGDESTWEGTAYTLFPIIGRFMADTYQADGKRCKMGLNGIAMKATFDVTAREKACASMRLVPNARRFAAYPFDFALTVTHRLEGNTLVYHYDIENNGGVPMPFGLGCHAGYRWPLYPGKEKSTDYFLRFEQRETLDSFSPFGWNAPFLAGQSERALDHSLFSNGTRSLRGLKSSWVELASRTNPHYVRIERAEFPFLAIWAMDVEEAPFVCLEPCTSIASWGPRIEDRPGSVVLQPGEKTAREFRVSFY